MELIKTLKSVQHFPKYTYSETTGNPYYCGHFQKQINFVIDMNPEYFHKTFNGSICVFYQDQNEELLKWDHQHI